MNQKERKEIEAIKTDLQSKLVRLEELQKIIKKKEKNISDKIPDSPTALKLEFESDNLENVVEELWLVDAFLRQALKGEH